MRDALERAKALRWEGRPQDAALELRKALLGAGDRCEVLYLLWDCQFVMGDRAAAHETLLEAKGLATGEMVARIAVAEASWLMSQGEYSHAVAKLAAVDTDDDEIRAYALSVKGVCEAFLGDVERGTATLEDARTAAHRSGSIRELTRAVGNLTFVLGSSGQHERSARIGKEALTRLGIQGLAPTFSAVIRYNLSTSLLALGRWQELDALDVPDAVPGNKAARIMLCKAEAMALRGRDPDDLIEQAEKVIEGPDALFSAQAAYTRAVAARAKGRFRAAVELCRETVADLPAALTGGEVLRLCAAGLGAARDLQSAGGRVTKLDDPEATEQELLARIPAPQGPEDEVWRRLAFAEAGRDSWDEIAVEWDRLKMPYQAAYARTRCGEPEALRHADRTARRLEALPLVKMIDRQARRQRIPLLHKDKPRIGTLTPRERDVLELLGWGRTNKEIAEELVLSVRTVGLHVSHVLAKLGASNRSEAARIARDQT
ncbi:LuxR C-terminal-related transcriptional regulator [Lentzea flava]|uniref:LuxR C-terminal-related transcriptional regulator n=1 Tax=Lentzea flava TaxID=103732 RepID=UPI00166F9E99|nr:LuxR C-terminal-related transcriptional regulator [Lentzea flava]MCP2202552.1 regulatory protein, luxR family [Lentzea flava]